MEKYRRWTDQTTGINPFIQAKQTTTKLTTIITSAIIAFLKLNILILIGPLIALSIVLQQKLYKTSLSQIMLVPIQVLVKLMGLGSCDDANFQKWVRKNSGKGKLVLANSLHILDAFYFMSKFPAVRFIVSSPDEDKFHVISGINAILEIINNKQPFFVENANNNDLTLKELVSKEILEGHTCILFYEGVRTLGLGTIKISQKLSTELLNLEKDYCIAHLKYSSVPQNTISVVTHPLVLFLMTLGSWGISLRVRFNPVQIKDQHSSGDIQKDTDNFLLGNGSKLLETNPGSYFQFLDFYFKSQKGGYTQLSQSE